MDVWYLASVFRDVKSRRVFKNLGIKLKYIFQETAILVFILLLAVFSYLKNTNFIGSGVARSMQKVVIVMVLVAIVSEALSAIWTLFCSLEDFLKERKVKKLAEKSKLITIEEERSRREVADEKIAAKTDEEIPENHVKKIPSKQWKHTQI